MEVYIGNGNDIYVHESSCNYLYKKQIFESIIAKYVENIKDIYIMHQIFLIYRLLR